MNRRYECIVTLPSGAVLSPRIVEAENAWEAAQIMKEKYPGSTINAKSLDPWIREIREQFESKLVKPPVIVDCIECGKPFPQKHTNHKFCCRECRYIATHRRRGKRETARRDIPFLDKDKPPNERREGLSKICPVCGEWFISKVNQKRCSRKCTVNYHKDIAKAQRKYNRTMKPPKPQQCIECGKSFIKKSTNQKYCGRICQQIVMQRRKKAKYHARKALNTEKEEP